MENLPILYIVVPCYNEEEVLPETSDILKCKINELTAKKMIDQKSKVVLVNDGSKDKTWNIIENLHKEDSVFQGIKLSRNRGHQNALVAGLTYSVDNADIMITIDADLQDDVNSINKMVDEYLKGSEIVYGVRSSRKKDSFFKRTTAQGFYKLMRHLGVDIVYNHADYRLMDKKAVKYLLEFKETNLFLRGMVPLVGLKNSVVTYERKERTKGVSKYPLKKMISFAFDGITSFSVKPLKFIFSCGAFITFLAFAFTLFSIIALSCGLSFVSWPWIIIGSIFLVGGFQTLMIGIVGEYVGKIYGETKRRPRFFIDEILN